MFGMPLFFWPALNRFNALSSSIQIRRPVLQPIIRRRIIFKPCPHAH